VNDTIYVVVEGDGEEAAAPSLLRRLLHHYIQRFDLGVKAYNAHGNSNIIATGQLEKILEVTRRTADCTGVIILLDAEREHCECPPDLASILARRAEALGLPFPVTVVCACCEYESWFLLNLHTPIKNWLKPGTTYAGDAEQECGAKGWLRRHMPPGDTYKEAIDQPRMTEHLDLLHTMEHSRSFRRLVHAVDELLFAIDSGTTLVTPAPQET
jgi:hypothetical protein